MHPPFGFELFYLRSVAPKKPYLDRITGRLTAPVSTAQIYRGAIPFVGIQLLMVALVMMMPSLAVRQKVKVAAPPQSSVVAPSAAPVHGSGFALPGTPPVIDGAPEQPPLSGPGAPTLDLRQLPNLDAPQRIMPSNTEP